ncbi:chemotaxis protein CheW [Lysobacter capsici]|uniref:chemotaxis protein CheW n=1 Tax=Lysobacter capsici TaxID=435897 RepID=UPI001C007300|nr:chemotaxis protein CheW [Lysobacter capsici]QWF19544.1 chemotaxis protein CheW [Lysobacter capsici]
MTDHPAIEASASAVAQLLGRAPDPQALHRATGEVAAKADDLRSLTRSLFVFRLRGEWLGLPASIVDEVLEPRAIHSLPHRREGLVRGLVKRAPRARPGAPPQATTRDRLPTTPRVR